LTMMKRSKTDSLSGERPAVYAVLVYWDSGVRSVLVIGSNESDGIVTAVSGNISVTMILVKPDQCSLDTRL